MAEQGEERFFRSEENNESVEPKLVSVSPSVCSRVVVWGVYAFALSCCGGHWSMR